MLLSAPGDRFYAAEATALLREPHSQAAVVRLLRAGDELVEIDPPNDDELTGRRLAREWCAAQTVDVPSGRSFTGYLPRKEMSADPLPPARRAAELGSALDQILATLEGREKAFVDLRDQVLAWRKRGETDPSARAEAGRLSERLASYMETQITPMALDAQDLLGELRELEDPRAQALGKRYERAARIFRP